MRSAFLVLLGCFITFSAQAQVNTEAMRKLDPQPGWHNNLSLSLSALSGNTDLLLLRTSFRSDYLQPPYHTFLVTRFQHGRKDGRSFTRKGFAHLRGIRTLQPRLMVEGFLQKQFNESILLKDRNLAGGGLRLVLWQRRTPAVQAPVFNLFLGIGAMWENERIDQPQEEGTSIVRSTNYLTGNWRATKGLNLSATCYYQIHLGRASDYRVLLESSVELELSQRSSFQTRLNLRYDHEPPAGIATRDLEITQGVSYTF